MVSDSVSIIDSKIFLNADNNSLYVIPCIIFKPY